MKKNIALLTSFAVLAISLLIFRYTENDLVKKIAGMKKNNYLYSIELNNEGEFLDSFIIQDDNIYYLTYNEDNTSSTLYKKSIYQNKSEKIKDTITSYCSLEKKYVYCHNDVDITVYDLNLDEIYKMDAREDLISILPFKGDFLVLENNRIYNTNKDTYQNFPDELKDLVFEDFYEQTGQVLFKNYDTETYYIYNLESEQYITIKAVYDGIYNNGFYFFTEEEVIIYDLKNGKTNKYSNSINPEYLYSSTLSDSGEKLYYYNIKNNTFNIINLKLETIKSITLNTDNLVTTIYYQNNYLYVRIDREEKNFYLVDLENVDIKEENIEEYYEKQVGMINNIKESIKNKLDVNIKTKEEAIISFPDFKADVEEDNVTIIKGLTKIKSILEKYNKEFFANFSDDDFKGLNIYLTGLLEPKDLETQISNPAAYSLLYNDEYMIVIDIDQPNIEELICHELMHNIELNLKRRNIEIFEEWDKYNPEDFTYHDAYNKESIYNYTLTEETLDNVYFIDTYSHSFAIEDRARIFENICACKENSIINDYPKIYQKASYLKEEMISKIPELKNTNLFNSLN